MASKFKEEERRRLLVLIQEWNLNRLDLFALSEPNENLDFFGVMRFFYQDEGEKVSTKCVRVSSTATTRDVIEILVEKFRPDMRMLTKAAYSLLEVHVNGDERKLMDHERPLLTQLNWGRDDREGRFLLRKEADKSSLGRLSSSTGELSTAGKDGGGSFKRKLSKKEKKELKKKEKEEKMKQLASRGSEVEEGRAGSKEGVAEKLYSELPESSFTRSISNPELVMRRRRQMKLGRPLQEMSTPDGAQGGTLKIYGQSIKPDVPYKTLLLSVDNTVEQVVAEALEKYGYENEDPSHFCLVQVLVPLDGTENCKEVRERVMDDDECPLNLLLQHPPSKGSIKFHLRLRPPDAPVRRRHGEQRSSKLFDSNYSMDHEPSRLTSFLLPVGSDGREVMNVERVALPYGMTEVGRERSHGSDVPFVFLSSPDILPQHCSITRSAGGATWITPSNHEAAVIFINGHRIREPTQIHNGQVVQVGRSYFFRFLESPPSKVPPAIQNSNYTGNNKHLYNNTNDLRSPSSSSSSRASTARPAKDFETTFDLDGQVLTVPSHLAGPINKNNNNNVNEGSYNLKNNSPNMGISQQHKIAQLPDNLLPANFSFTDGYEDRFLKECISDVNFAAIQFKMSPSFLLYLTTRARMRRSTATTNQGITSFATKVSQLIYRSVQENTGNPPLLSFWLANSSELKNFFRFDGQLSRLTEQAQHTLMDVIQVAFMSFVDCLKGELEQTLPSFLSLGPDAGELDAVEDFVMKRLPPKLGNVTHVLNLAMSVLRRCRVNATVTILIFSQLFRYISSWVFNCVLLDGRLRLCTMDWGRRLRLRLQHVMLWAEKQGLELAAECHTTKLLQLCMILECRKTELLQIMQSCDLINSIQMQTLLSNYIPGHDEPPLSRELVERAINMASDVDFDIRKEGSEPQLPEPLDLQVTLVFPDEGFCSDTMLGIPPGMIDFIDGFIRSGVGNFSVNPGASGSWCVYFDRSQVADKDGALRGGPEMIVVTLNKINNSLGLSIVAAQGEGQMEKGIYVKSVVERGAADLDGRIQTGDQLIEVGGRSLVGVSQEKAAEMMSQAGQIVKIKILKEAASYHGLSALLDAALQEVPRQAQAQRQPRSMSAGEGQLRVHDAPRFNGDSPSSASPVPAHVGYYDNRGQGSNAWRQEAGSNALLTEDPYSSRRQPNPPYGSTSHVSTSFSGGMSSSLSDPNLVDPDRGGFQMRPGMPGAVKFNMQSDFQKNPPFHGSAAYSVPSSDAETYYVKKDNLGIHSNLSQPGSSVQPEPSYGRQEFGRLAPGNQGKSNSLMPTPSQNYSQFPDIQPMKFHSGSQPNRAPRPSSAVVSPNNPGRRPGYATQMLFPKAPASSLNVVPPPSNRLSPQNISSSSSTSSNTDHLISNANQSSERSQAPPRVRTSSADYDFPPPPPALQLAQLKISDAAPVQPRPFESIQPNFYEGHQIKSGSDQNEIHPPASLASKKPPPVAIKPKITPADLKAAATFKSPWEKEAKEREEEEVMKRKRRDEVRRLENKPYLSPDEQARLKRLQTEEEFDQRLMQTKQEDQDYNVPSRELPRQPTSFYNSTGYGHQESQPAAAAYDSYRAREGDKHSPPAAFTQQMYKPAGGPVLKQQLQLPDISQSSLSTMSSVGGSMKKTVTFNENVGVNEYPVLRSYGSTSSDGSLAQSFDQSYASSYSDNSMSSAYQRNAPQVTLLPKIEDQGKLTHNLQSASQVAYEYKPKFNPEPAYTVRPSNENTSYPYRPMQGGTVTQGNNPMGLQQQSNVMYPYRPSPDISNQHVQAEPVYGKRNAADPAYVQRTYGRGNVMQENHYTSQNKALYGNR